MDKAKELPFAIYGAGFGARQAYEYLNAKGIEPVCFVDGDKNKWGGCSYSGNPLLIYSFTEAKEKYGDMNFYISVKSRFIRAEITHDLVEKYNVPIEQIYNYEPYIKRKSCILIEHTISPYGERDVGLCRGGRYINTTKMPTVPWLDDQKETLDNFLKMRDDLIKGINENIEESPCKGCNILFDKYCPSEYRVVDYVMATAPKSLCNFKCSYCYAGHFGDINIQENNRKKGQTDKRVEFAREMERRGIIHPSFTTLHFSDGEICVDPKRDGLYAIADEYYNSWFYSNGSIFSEEIAALMKKKKANIHVALDSGTAQTFKKIKGVDAFEKVCDNLRKYASVDNKRVTLKYIYLPGINSNQTDIDGFVGLCNELNPQSCCINADAVSDREDLPDKDLKLIAYLIMSLLKGDQLVDISGELFFSISEKKKIAQYAEPMIEKNDIRLHKLLQKTLSAEMTY